MECKGKRRYSREQAEKACFAVWAKDPSVDIDDLRPYQCPQCNRYHLGHKSKYEARVGAIYPVDGARLISATKQGSTP